MVSPDFSGLNLLQDLLFYRTYAETKSSGFKETFDETVDRSMQMHIDKFPKHSDAIVKAFSLVRNKIFVPSMRSFQFAGRAVKRENLRMYNCSWIPIDNVHCFGDVAYALMVGAGVGFSVQKCHISQLPVIKRPHPDYWVISDDREGWADSFKQLVMNPGLEFVYGFIRPAGARLSSGGTASGSDVLKQSHAKIREILLSAAGRKLRSIEVHDIICHIADCVVAGGSRRSATLSQFDADDEEMLNCKSGNWWEKNPQRGRANNSATIYRDDADFGSKFYQAMFSSISSNCGEPGILLSNCNDYGYNPCQPAWAKVLTPEGIRTFADIDVGSTIWSGSAWTKVLDKWSTGVKNVYRYNTTKGFFEGTENHRIVQDGTKIEVGLAESIDPCVGEFGTSVLLPESVMDGLVIGDGMCHKASNNLIGLIIGNNDGDYFTSEISHLIRKDSPKVGPKFFAVETSIIPEEMARIYERKIPDRIFSASSDIKRSFLRGLYSANGSVVAKGTRVTLKATSFELIRQAQLMLSSLGIQSYFTTNAPSEIEWNNGTFISRESYDLNITSDRFKFLESIGFIQNYKNEKISGSPGSNRKTAPVTSVEDLGEHEVFDITVDCDEHTYWTGGCLVSNCGEISLKAVCNLTEINAPACRTKAQFLEAVNAATFVGKLQSTYTDFHYVQERFKKWAEEEMLLGVSITGQADAWNLIGDRDVLLSGSAEALRTDEEWAKILGVPLAKRICTTKPSGSTSLLLGVSSGIHAAHAPFYIRRIRLDKTDPVAKYLIEQVGVGEACSGSIVETDRFAPHNVVVSVPVMKSGSIVRNQESAVSLMNRAKHVHDNWIKPTHREGPNSHNVSLTVNYRPNEVGEMIDWMHKNRDSYSGISILPDSDSSFVQLPFEEISMQDYVTWKEKFQDVRFDLSTINFGGTVDSRQGEMACAGGACQISSL
jgi:ribonucleotide reductase class II